MLVAKWCRFLMKSPQKCCCARFHTSCMSLAESHYEVLGVSKSATADEIKKAYFRLCKEYHPDKNQNDKRKLKKFLKINDAYTVLSNSETRRHYDTNGKRPPMYSDNFHEQYSSAYRENPYVRRRQRSAKYSDWEKFYAHQRSHFERERWRPKDRLEGYWEEYYKRQRNSTGYYTRPPSWYMPDRVVTFIVTLTITLLLMRFVAAGIVANSRTALEEIELQRHYEFKRRMEERKTVNDPESQVEDKFSENLEDV